jgi:hypothetical protein
VRCKTVASKKTLQALSEVQAQARSRRRPPATACGKLAVLKGAHAMT